MVHSSTCKTPKSIVENIINLKSMYNLCTKTYAELNAIYFELKGNAQFVQNTTFGLWEKNDSSTPENVL